jgi:hypothetical protein
MKAIVLNRVKNCFFLIDLKIKFKLHFLILVLTFTFFCHFSGLKAQSLTGTTGYFNIPSGEIYKDKTLFFGSNRLHKDYTNWGKENHYAADFFVTTTYLPFAEISIRFTRMLGLDDYSSTVGDRMASVRLQALKEGEFRPAVVIGVQNFFTTLSSGDASHFHSSYIVATKNFQFNKVIHNLGITAGYGSDKLFKAANYQFIGFFSGINIVPRHLEFIELMAEYDGDKLNCGIRLTLLKHIVILAGMEGVDTFSGVRYVPQKSFGRNVLELLEPFSGGISVKFVLP